MNRERHIVGIDGDVRYTLTYQTYQSKGVAVDPKWSNSWRWFLSVDDEYVGDFLTKGDALSVLEHEINQG